MIVGAGGTGKSTLARRIGAITGLPVIHLDAEYWGSGWVPMPEVEWQQRVRDLAARDAWVMDGNYGGTMDERLARADTVVFLDLPRLVATAGILRRWLAHRGRTRPDMTPGCPERMQFEFVRWVWDYNRTRRPARARATGDAATGTRRGAQVARGDRALGRGARARVQRRRLTWMPWTPRVVAHILSPVASPAIPTSRPHLPSSCPDFVPPSASSAALSSSPALARTRCSAGPRCGRSSRAQARPPT